MKSISKLKVGIVSISVKIHKQCQYEIVVSIIKAKSKINGNDPDIIIK